MNRYLITGTTSGIGQAIRRHIEGDIFELNRTQANLNNPDEVMALEIPTVDYAILNAGHDTGGGVNFLEHNPKHMFDIINCNLTSNMLLSQKILNKNKHAVIVLVTSTNLNKHYPNNLAYNLSKMGLKNLGDLIKVDIPYAQIKEARIGLTKTEFNNNRHKPGHKPINDLYAFEHLTVDAVAEKIIRLMFSDKDFEQINAK